MEQTIGSHHDVNEASAALVTLSIYYGLSGVNLCLNLLSLIFHLRYCYSLLIFRMVNCFSEFFHSASLCKELVDGILD